jgi:hypothetical protein
MRKFLSRNDISAQKARVPFLEVTRQHALGVAGHVDIAKHFGGCLVMSHQPAATGLHGGTVDYEFSIPSIAVQKVLKHTNGLKHGKTFAFCGEAQSPLSISISNEDCIAIGAHHKKVIISYRQGQRGPGAANLQQPCPGILEAAKSAGLMVRHGNVLVLAIAVYCGHTPNGHNQYFDRLHLQGTSTTNTSKRVQADDPCEGAACQHIVKKKKLTKDVAFLEFKEVEVSKTDMTINRLACYIFTFKSLSLSKPRKFTIFH